jgi:hypothetical protein
VIFLSIVLKINNLFMMKRLSLFLFLTFLTSTVDAQDTLRVLFIGNSFTFMNDMPNLFKGIAESEGKMVIVDKVTQRGKSFEYHANNPDTYEAIKRKKWDFVILQEHSNTPAQPETKVDKISLPFAKQLADSIRVNNDCTQLILYMTWGYKNGNSQWQEIGTYELMQERLYQSYLRYADILNAHVAPVGAVWRQVRKNYPGLNLYDKDNQHPSKLGSYLAASTFYATIFGESPYGASFTGEIDVFSAEMIQLVASQVVLNNPNTWRIIYNSKPIRTGFDVLIKGDKVRLFDRSENALTVEWDFGNGLVSREANPEIKYAKKGTYTIRQTISGECATKILERTIVID